MPVGEYFKGHGSEVMANMKDQYGSKEGERVFYATANKKGQKPKHSNHVLDGIKNVVSKAGRAKSRPAYNGDRTGEALGSIADQTPSYPSKQVPTKR